MVNINESKTDMSQGDLSKEKLLVQRYRLKEVVGTGGMGTVYRAEDTASKGKNVAVKILSRPIDEINMIEQFQREATISALLSESSPNIVKVTDYGINEEKVPFYAMEYLDGENLSDLIDVYDLSLEQFFDLTVQICRAMQIAHNGIFSSGKICPVIHRDLKPSNIFIIEDSAGKQIVKVLDFGIAKLVKDEEGKTECFMGTPRYCSPEQIRGEELDNRSDIYSLGMIMYFMLTQKYPWDLEIDSVGEWYKAHTELSPNKFPPELKIPSQLENLVLHCLAKAANNRPQSIGEVMQKLEIISRQLKSANQEKVQSDNTNQAEFSHQVSQRNSLEKFLYANTWPDNKPKQKIVFPRLVTFQNQLIPTICTMLGEKDIHKRQDNIRYNKFIFQSFPHPMLLWLTVLYSAEESARWLPCYLDLKTKIGTQVINKLSDSKEYFLLFFSLENPHQCQNLLSFKVSLKQRTNLKQWASVSRMLNVKHNEEALITRRQLKEDLAELKPKILLELAQATKEEIHG